MKKIQNSLRENRIKLLYLFTLGITFCVFLILAFLNMQIKKQITQMGVILDPMSFVSADYPVIQNKLLEPYISAQGAVVIDRESQVTIYDKSAQYRFPPASTTKIMTALVALDYYKLGDVLEIKQPIVEGSFSGFKKGEKFYFEDLFYAMLLPSANDATLAIADNYPGGKDMFVQKMNEKAKELHLDSTYYEDPIGLEDEKDYTTALDLARLTTIALKNPEFALVVSTKNKIITNVQGKKYPISNLNTLLDLPGITGVKTGFTEGAGQVLVTSKKTQDGREIIIVVMQSLDRFGDTESLLNYLNGNINYLSIQP